MDTSLIIFSSLLPILGGITLLLLGLIFNDNFEALLMLITHREIPSYVKEKTEVSSVLTYFKAIGILFKIIGVGLIVYGLVVAGVAIF